MLTAHIHLAVSATTSRILKNIYQIKIRKTVSLMFRDVDSYEAEETNDSPKFEPEGNCFCVFQIRTEQITLMSKFFILPPLNWQSGYGSDALQCHFKTS